MFDSKIELQAHTQTHMRESKPYKCSRCSKSFANSSYLSQHMRIHLNLKPFGPCQYCNRTFTQLSHLQQHLRTHTGEKPYKCRFNGCDKAFSQLSNLQSHSRCHQSDKPFKCNSCYKCFPDEQGLLAHIPKHNETKHVKKCICPYCGKSYSQHSYLAKHMSKHADKKPLQIRPPIGRFDESPTWPGSAICAIHNVVDSCVTFDTASVAAAAALPYSLSSAHPHSHHQVMMAAGVSSQSYPPSPSTACISYPTAAGGMSGSDPTSAFTRIAGLETLSRMAASSRTPYLEAYANLNKSAGPHGAVLGHHPGAVSSFPNQLIRLDDIRQYTDTFQMLTGKRESREAAY